MNSKKKIYLVDGYNFIYRLFYAIPPFTLKDGTPINTVFGLAKTILSWSEEDKPEYLVFILDYKGTKVREKIYSEYKGTRDKMPTDLKLQEDLIFELLEKLQIPVITHEGYEADDIIGTLATKYKKDEDKEVYILSGDKDLYQFIGDNVRVYDTMKKKIFDRKDAFEKFGVYPEHVVDYLSICGDSSDNIPGIPSFGPKKAQDLIGKYGCLENIYKNLDDITGKAKEVLIENEKIAFMSKELAKIHIDLKLKNYNLENHKFKGKELINKDVVKLFKKFEFKSLIPEEFRGEIFNFDKLEVSIKEINSEEELEKLKKEIIKAGRIGISTSSSKAFSLDSITIYIGGEYIYSIKADLFDIKDFLKELLKSDIEISSFGIKEDLKRIKGCIENINLSIDEFQGSLF